MSHFRDLGPSIYWLSSVFHFIFSESEDQDLFSSSQQKEAVNQGVRGEWKIRPMSQILNVGLYILLGLQVLPLICQATV